MGGDGFGKQIGIAQLRGPKSMFFLAGIVPGQHPPKALGVKVQMGTGDIIGLDKLARLDCVHAVVAVVPGGAHHNNCF